jgi:hypothetical protein
VTRGLIRAVAEELQKADPNNTAVEIVMEQFTGTRLDVSDGLALVGQLQATL